MSPRGDTATFGGVAVCAGKSARAGQRPHYQVLELLGITAGPLQAYENFEELDRNLSSHTLGVTAAEGR